LLAHNLVSDPNLQVEVLADFDLSKLRNAIPIDSDDDIKGKVFADIFIKGKMSDIENENYNKFDARGNIRLTNFSFSLHLQFIYIIGQDHQSSGTLTAF